MIFVIHDENGTPITAGGRRPRQQPKAYFTERNAKCAIGNGRNGEIVPYVPREEVAKMYRIVRQLYTGDIPELDAVGAILQRCGYELDEELFITEVSAE
jgi:hypothetical protein